MQLLLHGLRKSGERGREEALAYTYIHTTLTTLLLLLSAELWLVSQLEKVWLLKGHKRWSKRQRKKKEGGKLELLLQLLFIQTCWFGLDWIGLHGCGGWYYTHTM